MLYPAEQLTHEAFVLRVTERMKILNMNTRQLAAAAGISESFLKNRLYKHTEIGRMDLIALASALRTSVEYLATGSEVGERESIVTLVVQSPEGLAASLNIIPADVVSPSMAPPLATVPLPRGAISRFNVAAANIRAVVVNSETLTPTLVQGDIALVDISSTRLAEGIFFIAFRDSVVMRFVSPIAKGFSLASSCPHIFGTTVNVDQNDGVIEDTGIKVIGRVFGVVRMGAL